jgi:hypothetical protein
MAGPLATDQRYDPGSDFPPLNLILISDFLFSVHPTPSCKFVTLNSSGPWTLTAVPPVFGGPFGYLTDWKLPEN